MKLFKQILVFIFTIIPVILLINIFIYLYEQITDKRDIVCRGEGSGGRHNWIYWNANLISKKYPNMNGTLRNHVRKCSNCEVQHKWHRWSGLGGEGLWERSYHELSYDKEDVDIEIFTIEELQQQKRKEDIQNLKSNKRGKRLDKLLNK
ncbi:MAG: hypothetical protein SLAVMIC_00714 [uncultured marine phage]|uniref:Uncharacterized protein n=1 Tax=uncultured marine phage TaxID=707152 RepID=A0A8D9CC09_9VIRU|nr:MAG: hypothetical protein SLAVMIC_00714 [uncultured marine phage]